MKEKLITLWYFVQTRWLRKLRTRQAVERLQARMIRRHFAYLHKHSPYYAARPKIRTIDDLHALPIMDKATSLAHFDSMNTLGLRKDKALRLAIKSERTRDFAPTYNGVSVGLSSGTSGHRGLFVASDFERASWAGAVLAKFLPKNNITGHKIAFFLRANNNLYETVHSRFITFKYFDIYKNISVLLQELEQYQPTILIAPPSVLGLIANAAQQGKMHLNVQKVISVAEVLSPNDEKRFKRLFRQKYIYQAYQCTEGFLAHTCQEGSLHLNEDIVYIEKEFVDKHRFIPIITDFRRKTQPIVRYRLNDILVLSNKACLCGMATTVIERIEGREDDIFLFKDKSDAIVKVFPDIIARCVIYTKGIGEYRVTQISQDAMLVQIDTGSASVKRAISKEFKNLAQKMSFIAPTITFTGYSLDLDRKLKRIERRF